jgi:hypothetical protein
VFYYGGERAGGKKIKKKYPIKKDEKNARLEIKYWLDGKTKSVRKRYTDCGEDVAMKYMVAKQKELIEEFAAMLQ